MADSRPFERLSEALGHSLHTLDYGCGPGRGGYLHDRGGGSGGLDAWGVAASLGATSLMAIGAVLGKRWEDGTSILCTTAWQLEAGGIELMIVAVLVEGSPPPIDAERLMSFSYVSLIATGLTCVCLFTAFRHQRRGW